jgi:hypothetical protein
MEKKKKGIYNERSGAILAIAGFVVFVLALIFMNPLGEGLGVSESPGRITLLYIFAFAFCLPFGAYFMYLFAQRPDWLVQPGRYIEGMKVRVFSPYALVAMGIVGALFAAAGLGDLGGIDVQAMVISASAALFGAVISFFGLFVGQIIARIFINPVWSGGTSTAAVTLLPYTLIDASIWAYAGYMYFRIVHDRKQRSFIVAFLLAWLATEPIHQLWWFVTYWIMNTREAATLAVLNDWVVGGINLVPIPYWWLSGLLFVPVGYLAGEAARRALSGGRGSEAEKPKETDA